MRVPAREWRAAQRRTSTTLDSAHLRSLPPLHAALHPALHHSAACDHTCSPPARGSDCDSPVCSAWAPARPSPEPRTAPGAVRAADMSDMPPPAGGKPAAKRRKAGDGDVKTGAAKFRRGPEVATRQVGGWEGGVAGRGASVPCRTRAWQHPTTPYCAPLLPIAVVGARPAPAPAPPAWRLPRAWRSRAQATAAPGYPVREVALRVMLRALGFAAAVVCQPHQHQGMCKDCGRPPPDAAVDSGCAQWAWRWAGLASAVPQEEVGHGDFLVPVSTSPPTPCNPVQKRCTPPLPHCTTPPLPSRQSLVTCGESKAPRPPPACQPTAILRAAAGQPPALPSPAGEWAPRKLKQSAERQT